MRYDKKILLLAETIIFTPQVSQPVPQPLSGEDEVYRACFLPNARWDQAWGKYVELNKLAHTSNKITLAHTERAVRYSNFARQSLTLARLQLQNHFTRDQS
jgi:peptidase E